MLANMAVSLIMHEQIKTTLPKAKELSAYIQKLITQAKYSSLANRRMIIAKIRSREAVDKLINVLGKRYQNRYGGYVRIVKSGFRYGDMAHMSYIELVNRDIYAKGSNITTSDQQLKPIESLSK